MSNATPIAKRFSLLAALSPYSPLNQRAKLALIGALTVWIYEIGTYSFIWLVAGLHLLPILIWVAGRVFILPFIFAAFLLARSMRFHAGELVIFVSKQLTVAVTYLLVVRPVLYLLNYFAPAPDDLRTALMRRHSLWEHLQGLTHWSTWSGSLNETMAGYFLGLLTMFAVDMLLLYKSMQQMTAELREAYLKLEEASQTDLLTGARNRRYLADQLPLDMAQFRRQFSRPGGQDQRMLFALMDLDHFKRINDSYGHSQGDRLLAEFAELLKRAIRQGDYLVRWGGEEFLIILRDVRSGEVPAYAERIRKAVQDYHFTAPDQRRLHITCSMGIAEYPFCAEEPDAFDWEAVVMLADRAMYTIKRGGRNGAALVRLTPGASVAALKQQLDSGYDHLVEQGLLHLTVYRDGRSAS